MLNTPPVRVLISYAWENDPEYSNSIWNLAGWLTAASNERITVITDHLHKYRPPTKGWHVWMREEIERADVVLCVCSPLYIERFEKSDDGAQGGIGVTLEGAYITAILSEGKLRNDKFFPILPSGGDRSNIPLILRPYNNDHNFPDGNEGILKLVLNENPSHKESVAASDNGNDRIKTEKEILQDFKEIYPQSTMAITLQILIRSYLALNEVDKVSIAKNLEIFSDDLGKMTSPNRDKQILHRIHEKSLIPQLWDQINLIKPFENNTNPFK